VDCIYQYNLRGQIILIYTGILRIHNGTLKNVICINLYPYRVQSAQYWAGIDHSSTQVQYWQTTGPVLTKYWMT